MNELVEIISINGERQTVDYNNRRKTFNSQEEIEKYRTYLEKKLNKQIFFIHKTKA
jgi:hypothetical protein